MQVPAARGIFAVGHALGGIDEHHVIVDWSGQSSQGGLRVFGSLRYPRLWDVGVEEGMRGGVVVLQDAQSVARLSCSRSCSCIPM